MNVGSTRDKQRPGRGDVEPGNHATRLFGDQATCGEIPGVQPPFKEAVQQQAAT